MINRGAEPVRLGAIAINTAARQKHSPPSLKLRRATFAEQRLACQPKRHRSRIYPRSLLFNTKSATADLVCREGWCRRRDLNPRPPAYEMKNRNVSAVYGDVLRGARICVRTRFATHQIFCHDRISAYSWELGRTAHETGDCNHAVTRKSAAPAFVRYWSNSEQKWIKDPDSLSAFDPKRTLRSGIRNGARGSYVWNMRRGATACQ